MARELHQAVIVRADGKHIRFDLFLAEPGKRLQLASVGIDLAAATVVSTDLERLLARRRGPGGR